MTNGLITCNIVYSTSLVLGLSKLLLLLVKGLGMNSKSFYDSIRAELFKGVISSKQFEGIESIISEYNKQCVNDVRKLAYILATAYHETSKTMQPIAEYGKGKNYDYGKKLKMNRKPYTTPNQLYYGRGFVQLTWYENYEAMGKRLNLDLLNNPDLMLTLEPSIQTMFIGMKMGMFTGRKLSDYFNDTKTDWIGARRIINGLDKADLIAQYAKTFYKALTLE